MLVLTRREGERIRLGDHIVVSVVSIQGNKVRIGVEAPDEVSIRRGELVSNGDEPTKSKRKVAEPV